MPVLGEVTSGFSWGWKICFRDGSYVGGNRVMLAVAKRPWCSPRGVLHQAARATRPPGMLVFLKNLRWRGREQAAASRTSESIRSHAFCSLLLWWTTAHSMWSQTEVRDGLAKASQRLFSTEPAEVFYNSNKTLSILPNIKMFVSFPWPLYMTMSLRLCITSSFQHTAVQSIFPVLHWSGWSFRAKIMKRWRRGVVMTKRELEGINLHILQLGQMQNIGAIFVDPREQVSLPSMQYHAPMACLA